MSREKDIFKNPCKYCLTKPICKRKCKELGNYHNTMIDCLLMILALTFIVSTILSTYLIWNISDMKIKVIILISLYTIIYGVAFKHTVINEQIDFEEGMNFIYIGFLLSLSPYILASMFIVHHIEKTEITDLFVYRYNKKLNPFEKGEDVTKNVRI